MRGLHGVDLGGCSLYQHMKESNMLRRAQGRKFHTGKHVCGPSLHEQIRCSSRLSTAAQTRPTSHRRPAFSVGLEVLRTPYCAVVVLASCKNLLDRTAAPRHTRTAAFLCPASCTRSEVLCRRSYPR